MEVEEERERRKKWSFGSNGWMSVGDDDVSKEKRRNGCVLLWKVKKREGWKEVVRKLVDWM